MGVCAHAYTHMKARGQPWYSSSGAVHLFPTFVCVCVGGGSSECAHVSLDVYGDQSECVHVSVSLCVCVCRGK